MNRGTNEGMNELLVTKEIEDSSCADSYLFSKLSNEEGNYLLLSVRKDSHRIQVERFVNKNSIKYGCGIEVSYHPHTIVKFQESRHCCIDEECNDHDYCTIDACNIK